MPAEATLTRAAEQRLRAPRTRGAFSQRDAARRRLALLEASDGAGQAAIFWLVELPAQRIADARFLAFGSLWSHPLADAFTELVRGRSLDEACALPLARVEALLRDDPEVPACAESELAFLADLQQRARAAAPQLAVPPPLTEKPVYQRKRPQDWNEHDRAWLPLSLLKKVAKVDAAIARVLADKAPQARHRVEGLHDDFRVVCLLEGVGDAERHTLALFIASALREIHPELTVEVPP
ncbi:MAG: iron-sulfur cluster assembly scaffold protein [Planctomycetota bacterium]|nr:iron-sulfur cluster assembly scaffold protein [Planctomycetota bacterium]MCX8040799.1 iron-sulfur cluster assembly scaffold protein [Planctomycetota bacterium]MDW8372390.1 iron-sulfur cluster assembly scaffold protein [Planctomycetota bacterium]